MPRKMPPPPAPLPLPSVDLDQAEAQLMAALGAILEAKHARSCLSMGKAIGAPDSPEHRATIRHQVAQAIQNASAAVSTLEG